MKRFAIALMAMLAAALCVEALEVRQVPTKNLPVEAMVSVALPADYGSNPQRSYPVVYLLNGHGGNHTTWGKIADLDSLASAYNTIIVCPAGLDSWYWNSPKVEAMKMESYIVDDLIGWVDGNYRTIADRSGRAVTGLSMGGHGALWLAIGHSDLFGAAGSTSGGVDLMPFPTNWNLTEHLGRQADNEQLWRSHTVMSRLPELQPGRLAIIFDCGTEDFFYEVNCELHRLLTARGIEHTYLTSPGAHKPDYWGRSIVPQLQFFNTFFYVN